MSAIDEKTATDGAEPVSPDFAPGEHHQSDAVPADALSLPSGWMYRQRKIAGHAFPWYASPKVQLFMVSMVCFLCPGMFNALSGMGGGGKADAKLADQMVSSHLL